MEEILLKIDNREVRAEEGMTVLQAAKSAGIHIPTLCHHDKLEPYGACRLCTVEIESGGATRYVAACLYPVEPNLVVRTRSEQVDRIRKLLLEYMLAHAPHSPQLNELAQQYGARRERFESEASFCVLCGRCERYCAEVKKKHGVGFVGNGPRREIAFVPAVAATECASCQECFPLCPTSYLQAAWVLCRALSPSPAAKEGA